MRRLVEILILALILVAGGYAAYLSFAPDLENRPSVEQGAAPESEAAASTQDNREVSVRGVDPVTEPANFVFRRLIVDTSADLPEACLVFSEPLDDTGRVRYGDYLKFDRGVQPGLSVRGEQLCIAGLDFASSYQVDIRQGMPSAGELPLAYDESITIELADRPARVQFGDGYVLPRGTSEGVTVTTVNVDSLDIRVFRIGDRLLAQLETGLIDQQALYAYETYEIENEDGALVWQGQMDVGGARNETVEIVFPVRQAVNDWQPGVYLVLAEDSENDERIRQSGRFFDNSVAAQWIIDSDIGLTSFSGTGGLTVFARSLRSAEPISNVRLVLVARNNEILAETRTNSSGQAAFDTALLRGPGGMEPVAVMAYGRADDFNFLDLRRPAFDLGDRGVDGRSVPGAIDAFLYTERGIYRPGEAVHLVAMLRDREVAALSDVPTTLVVSKPNGNEYRRIIVTEQSAGATAISVPLSTTAPRGRWSVAAYVDTGAPPVGRVSFDVQDFVPERLAVELATDDPYWQPGQSIEVGVTSRFLYGAPAAGLAGEAEIKVMVDPDPFPAFPGYRFGRIEERFNDEIDFVDLPVTDADGETRLLAEVPAIDPTSLPLRAQLRLSIFEPGGRATQAETMVPVRTRDVMIGIRPDFDDGRVRENTAAGFEIVAVDKSGAQIAATDLTYRLLREDFDYQWFQRNGRWEYEAIIRDREVGAGTLDADARQPARLEQSLGWGQYRLVVSDGVSGASTSLRFFVGWGGIAERGRPDRVPVSSDKDTYLVGETAQIDIRPAVAGKALVVVANDTIHDTLLVDVDPAGSRVSVPVSEDWGVGAYVLVTAYKPLTAEDARAPVRAIGVTWLGIDRSARTLSVAIDVPDRVEPRQSIEVPLRADGLGDGERAFVTLAAVDEGILQLTRYATPDPAAFYFGKRRLSVDMRDAYGHLIADANGPVGDLRVGGDAIGGRGLSVVPTRTVALFSGLVALDRDGTARIPLTIPDFAGELRLMAVVMSNDKVGSSDRALTVRDDVVADVTLPRFLAPGDESEVTVLLHNVDGVAGEYTADIAVSGAIRLQDGQDRLERRTALQNEQRLEFKLPVAGEAPGIGTVALTLTGPDGFEVVRTWPIEVRPAQSEESQDVVAQLAPGESFALDRSLIDDYYPDTASVSAVIAASRSFNVPGLLTSLDRYPYGCLEQTVSRAMPLLYFNDLLLMSGGDRDEALRGRVQNAVERVVDMQNPSGAFGMWGPYDFDANEWLSVFAFDFLTRARERDYVVPTDAIVRGTDWLKRLAGQSWQDTWARAYAYFVLAREGALSPGDLRYFADEEIYDVENPMSAAHIGAALMQIGDRSRANVAFDRAAMFFEEGSPLASTDMPYGSRLRDVSGVLTLAAESQYDAILPPLFDRLAGLESRLAFTTTQEKVWLLLAAHALAERSGTVSIRVEGADADGDQPAYLAPDPAELDAGVTVTNTGDRDIWRTVTVSGVPASPRPAAASGMTLARSFLSLSGAPVDLAGVAQNQQVVVLVQGQMNDDTYREMVALDLLPAGWEIEAVIDPDDRAYDFLPPLTMTRMAEARDDRFVAAFDMGSRFRSRRDENEEPRRPGFALAYVVRAVTPGTYVLPAVKVEDMYAPQVFARTEAGSIRVVAATQ